ncbi:hypothetical protein Mapa_011229 [Marchantia paleacea]|nr:hypothetical protein Mapa_011229 [Marchantia paleacea]
MSPITVTPCNSRTTSIPHYVCHWNSQTLKCRKGTGGTFVWKTELSSRTNEITGASTGNFPTG